MLVLRPGVSKVRIDELAFSPDGTAIAAPAGHQGVMLWKTLASGAKSAVIKPKIVCKRIAFAPNGKILYTGNDQLCAFDIADDDRTLVWIPNWAALWFGVSPDGTRLVVAENPKDTQHTRVTVWDTESLDKPMREVASPSMVYTPPLFLPASDRFILVEGVFRPSRVWEYRCVICSLQTGVIVEQSEPLPDCPDQVVISPDGASLASRTREVIRVYPAGGRWKDIPTFANDSKKQFTGIAYHPSGKFIAATSNDQTVKLYDTATWELAKTFTWDIGRMRSIAFSPDGTLAAAGSDSGKVVVWDVDV